MPRPRSFAVGLVALLLLGTAVAQECLDRSTVTTTALGAAYRAEDQALADAVTAALNQAITQARGVYVTARQDLWDSYQSRVVGGASDIDLARGFSREISSRFSGFVEHYEVLDRRSLGTGAIEVTVRVTVCLDARIAVGLDALPQARRAIVAALVDDVRAAGWQIISSGPPPNAGDSELLEFTLANGVSFIAQGDLSVAFGRQYDFDNATVTLNMVLIDTRTMQVSHTVSMTRTGVGPTREAALQDAGSKLGEELARAWNQAFLGQDHRYRSRFVFMGVRRPGTRFSLEAVVGQVPGVLRILDTQFHAARGEVHLTVETSADPCQIAVDVPSYRRVLTQLRSCAPGHARFRVMND